MEEQQRQSASSSGQTPLAPLGGSVPSFKDLMGFDAEVIMYEDDMSDPSIPDIQVHNALKTPPLPVVSLMRIGASEDHQAQQHTAALGECEDDELELAAAGERPPEWLLQELPRGGDYIPATHPRDLLQRDALGAVGARDTPNDRDVGDVRRGGRTA